MNRHRPRVLFIGAFNDKNPAVRGGQLAACTTLLRSAFAESFDLVLLDTTQVSVPPPPLAKRAGLAVFRVISAMRLLLFARVDALLVFCANGASFLEKGCITVVARALGKRVVLAPRSGYLLDEYQRSSLWRLVIRWVVRAASVLVCQGTAWRQFFIQAGAAPDRCIIVKNWIVAPELLLLPGARRRSGALRIVYLGWIEREKGLFDLVAAMRKVANTGRSVDLVIAGSGSARDALAAEVGRLRLEQAVGFFGWADAVQRRELLRGADVLIMPSHSEGMPNALLEGMLAGRAVIATSVGAVPDVIRDGDNGLLVSPHDVEGIATALIRLCDDPGLLETLAERARQTARSEHDVDVAAQRLIAAVNGLVP